MAEQYTEEERAAAWAAYYAQQGYTPEQVASMTGGWYPTQGAGASSSSAGASTAGTAEMPYVHSETGKYSLPGYDSNGYKIQTGSTKTGKAPALLDAELLKPVQIIGPVAGAAADKGKDKDKNGKQKAEQKPAQGLGAMRRETVIREAGGRKWEDPTLLEWDPKWYRLFVGDVSNEVTERTLDEAFGKYRTYCKCKVVRDRLSQKAKYGFIAFKDPEDYLRAWKEMDGKYVGNRPIRLSKVKEDKYGSIETVTLSARKAKEMDKLRKNRGKPLNGRPVPW